MDNRTPRTADASAADPTVDSVPRANLGASASVEASHPADGCCPVALVEGTGPRLTSEVHVLLLRRLRLAALLLSAGFAVFLVNHWFQTDFSQTAEVVLFAFHVVLVFAVGVVGASLCRGCAIPDWWLRVSEAVIFGLPAAFFAAMQYYVTCRLSAQGHFEPIVGPWLVLIYTYALFIPNTMRRAAVVIAAMALVPIVLLATMMATLPEVANVVTANHLVSLGLMIAVAAGGSVFGVDTIGSLHRQAFEARQLGQYRLTRRIGAGGMGEVYLAEHQLLKRPCVVKLIRPDKAGDPRVLARFQREVRATARLSHWNTVEIFDYGSTSDGTFYYVMEYLPGMSLAELVDRFGPLPPERVIHLLRQACGALSEAHAAGLIHRDIKPGNIFAAQRGGVYDVAKLLDFGLVKPVIEDEPIHLTTEGAITGSPLFMSPEQATGDGTPDARSDIYALGAVAYYLLTGRPPFVSDKPLKVLIAHAHEPVVPPSQLRPEIPADLEQVVLRCLAKPPDERFQDAAALERALAECDDADRWTREQAAQWWQEQEWQSTANRIEL
jgi:eukaryotic-like serine/threonine-protein kinase